jgi:hypothetical protein
MVFMINKIGQKIGQLKKKKSSIFKCKNVINNKYLLTKLPWPPTYLSTTHLDIIHFTNV